MELQRYHRGQWIKIAELKEEAEIKSGKAMVRNPAEHGEPYRLLDDKGEEVPA